MKFKAPLLVLFFFSCLCVFAQKANHARQNTPTVTELNTKIQQLQSDNHKLEEQLCALEKEVELYREDVRQKSTELNDNMSHWLAMLSGILAIIGVSLGVVAPILVNRGYEEQLKKYLDKGLQDVKTQLTSVSQQAKKAEDAVKTSETLKDQIDEMEKKIGNDTELAQNAARLSQEAKDKVSVLEKKIAKYSETAEKAAQEAKANRYFAEALAQKDPSKRMELYTQVIDLNPSISAYLNRGVAKYDLGDYRGAIEDYNKAIRIKPDFVSAFNNRACAKISLGDYDGAKEDIDKAFSLDPNFAFAYDTRGELKFALGDIDGAVNDHTKAIEINPKAASFYRNRAKAYRKMAAAETDEIKKKKYLVKADEDEKLVDSLSE